MRGCNRIPRHDAQALGAFACVSGPVGEARSSVGRSGVTADQRTPSRGALPRPLGADRRGAAREGVADPPRVGEPRGLAPGRGAGAHTPPPPSTPSPSLACPSLRSVAAVPDVVKGLQAAHPGPHARTHARTRCGCSRRSARSSSCSRRQCGRHGRRSLPTCVRATASADGVPQRYTRWCQHAARRVAQDVEAAALRERRLQEQLDESHDVRRSRTAARPAAQRGGLGGSLAAAHARARTAPPPSSSAHTRMRCAAVTALGGWAGDPVAARVQSDGRALAAPVPAGARSLDSVLWRYPGGTSGALGVPPGAAAQRATLHPAAGGL
jgi:hypothetical protein